MNNKKLNCHPELVEGSQQNCTASRDVAENTKLNHEIAKELRKHAPNHSSSSSGLTRGSRWLRKPYLTWIPVSHPQGDARITRIICLTLFTLLPSLAQAETCTATPDCKSLGYTETSCPDGGGVKCPWNTSLLYCGENGKKICADMGHPYTCTGANEIPSGKACANKYYTTCTCASGYEWKNGKCEEIICEVGMILNSDKTCTSEKTSGKTPIGVVFSSGKAVALNDLGGMSWSSADSQCSSYSASDVTGWFLPTKNELLAMYNNKSAVSSGLTVAGGSQFKSGYYWSSFHFRTNSDGSKDYWMVNPVSGRTVVGTDYGVTYDYEGYVRPVLSF